MADSFGSRARKFMGWYTPEDTESDYEDFDMIDDTPDAGEVAEVAPLSRQVVSPLRRDPETRHETHTDLSRIVTIHPASYNDALPIGEAFRKGVPVIINLTDMSEMEARRVIDFAAGLTFGLHGVIERVTNRVFLLSPHTIEVSGDITGSRRDALFNQG